MSSVFNFVFWLNILVQIIFITYALISHGTIETTYLIIAFSSLISTTLIKLSLKNNQENKNVTKE
jgi:hypothetical protein